MARKATVANAYVAWCWFLHTLAAARRLRGLRVWSVKGNKPPFVSSPQHRVPAAVLAPGRVQTKASRVRPTASLPATHHHHRPPQIFEPETILCELRRWARRGAHKEVLFEYLAARCYQFPPGVDKPPRPPRHRNLAVRPTVGVPDVVIVSLQWPSLRTFFAEIVRDLQNRNFSLRRDITFGQMFQKHVKLTFSRICFFF